MHRAMLVVLLAGVACSDRGWAQALTEAAAAAAGGSVGGVAGKKVSDGLTNIFNKVDKQTSKAAETPRPGAQKSSDATVAPLIEVGPGVPKGQPRQAESVPPPPQVPRAAVAPQRPAPPPPVPEVVPVPLPPPPPPPPPPQATTEDLKTVIPGMNREDVLRLGPPAARITMFDDGHLVETYRYMTGDISLGVVHLTDGAVSSVQVR